jgi:hypothetical protein
METEAGSAEIGQWYARSDKGEMFQVTGLDAHNRTIEIQTFDGDVDEIDEDEWTALPLTRTEPPEDWTGPVDVDKADLDNTDTEMTPQDWAAPLQSTVAAEESQEAWQDTSDPEERDPEGEGVPLEPFASEEPAAEVRLR